MTARAPHSIAQTIEILYTDCPDEEYSISERLITAANNLTVRLFLKIASLVSPKSPRTEADTIYRHVVYNFLQIVFAAFVLICVLVALLFPIFTLLNIDGPPQQTAQNTFTSLSDFYVFYSNEVFEDTSTFTTISIGVIAGSISIASLGRSAQSKQESNALVPYTELLSRFAFIYNGLFILFYTSQIVIWLTGIIWRSEICHETQEVGANGLSYFVIEECGIPSPSIAVTSVIAILVCGAIQSLTIHSRRQTITNINLAYKQLLESTDRIKAQTTPRRRLPVWNVVHLYTALSLLIILFTAVTLQFTTHSGSPVEVLPLIIGTYIMSLFSGIFRYSLFPYITGELSPRNWIFRLPTFLHIYLSLAFASSATNLLTVSATANSFVTLAVGSLTALNAPLLIGRLPAIKMRIEQKRLNEDFRLLHIRARRVEKYQMLLRVD
jgi:hypothetical protein